MAIHIPLHFEYTCSYDRHKKDSKAVKSDTVIELMDSFIQWVPAVLKGDIQIACYIKDISDWFWLEGKINYCQRGTNLNNLTILKVRYI